jgi:hypothetical protein
MMHLLTVILSIFEIRWPKVGDVRCNYRHPCYRLDDKSKNIKLAVIEDV